jgi:hypothetical protein
MLFGREEIMENISNDGCIVNAILNIEKCTILLHRNIHKEEERGACYTWKKSAYTTEVYGVCV